MGLADRSGLVERVVAGKAGFRRVEHQTTWKNNKGSTVFIHTGEGTMLRLDQSTRTPIADGRGAMEPSFVNRLAVPIRQIYLVVYRNVCFY